MTTVLRYGAQRSIELVTNGNAMWAEGGLPRGEPVPDVVAAVDAALTQPLNYPALARSTTPGDRVVLALGEGVPQSAEVVRAIIEHLVRCGAGLDGIAVLQPHVATSDSASLTRDWPPEWKERITVEVHNPDDRNKMAYLATTQGGEPVFLNRALTDADVVLPVGCLRRSSTLGYYGIHEALYPAFSSQKTIARFRAPGSLRSNGPRRRKQIEEVNEVAWLLGAMLTVQIVPGGGGQVLHVLAGEGRSVRRRGRDLYAAAWLYELPQRADLVVAAIEGDPSQQTWKNFGLALAAALRAVEDGGTIALCSDLRAAPGPAVQYLAGTESREEAMRQIRQDRPEDTFSAVQLARAQERSRVYLLGGLDPTLLEQLEIAPIADVAELARLIQRHNSCVILPNSPLAAVKVK